MARVEEGANYLGNGVRRTLFLLLRVGLVLAALTYALWDLDPARTLEALGRLSPLPILGALGLLALWFAVNGWRLALISGGLLHLRPAIIASIIGTGVNVMLPGKVGELSKALYLAHHGKPNRSQILGMILWERFWDLNIMLGLMAVSLAALNTGAHFYLLAAIVAAGWCAIALLALRPGLIRRLLPLIPGERFKIRFEYLGNQIRKMTALPILWRGAVLSLLVWLNYLAIYLLVLRSGAGIDLPLTEMLLVFAVASVGMAAPSTPGAIGVFEAAMVFILGRFGIARESALPAALVLHVIQLLPPLLFTLFYLVTRRFSLPDQNDGH